MIERKGYCRTLEVSVSQDRSILLACGSYIQQTPVAVAPRHMTYTVEPTELRKLGKVYSGVPCILSSDDILKSVFNDHIYDSFNWKELCRPTSFREAPFPG
jgi:hypothetical protein